MEHARTYVRPDSKRDGSPGMGRAMTNTAADWAALAYRVEGLDVRIEPLEEPEGKVSEAQLVIVPSLRRVECVVDANSDFEAVARQLAVMSGSGWSVWVLAPLTRLARARVAFGPAVDQLQGWWERSDRSVTFTAPQVP